MAFDAGIIFTSSGVGIAPTKTSSVGTTTTPVSNLTVFSYTTNGSYFQYQDLTVASSANAILPAGYYIITTANANIKVQVTTDGGTTWADLIAVSTLGTVFSDGASVRLINAAASAQLITVLTPSGALPGTYTFNS